jgi:hypothetical protein
VQIAHPTTIDSLSRIVAKSGELGTLATKQTCLKLTSTTIHVGLGDLHWQPKTRNNLENVFVLK